MVSYREIGYSEVAWNRQILICLTSLLTELDPDGVGRWEKICFKDPQARDT